MRAAEAIDEHLLEGELPERAGAKPKPKPKPMQLMGYFT